MAARPGQIEDVMIVEAGGHGLGIYDVQGWITHSTVEEASTLAADTYSALKVAGASIGSRTEDLLLTATGCDHAVDSDSPVRIGGIDVIGTATNGDYSVAPETIWSRAHHIPYSLGGTLVTGAGTFRLPFLYGGRIIAIRATVAVAPTGASIIVDVNLSGTTIFTTQANRPTIAVSTNMSGVAFPDVVNGNAGDYLTVDVDQVGSTIAGSDLVVSVLIENDD